MTRRRLPEPPRTSEQRRRPRAASSSLEHHLALVPEQTLWPQQDEQEDDQANDDQPQVCALIGGEPGKRSEVEEARAGENESEHESPDRNGPHASKPAEQQDHPGEERQQRLEVVGAEERELPRVEQSGD